jgi:uncharacterized protein (DUF1684 family)
MSDLQEFRQQKDQFFAHDRHSPLSSEQKQAFNGLDYYPENSALFFEKHVERAKDQQSVQMQTNTGEWRQYQKHGTFRFHVNGDEAELTVYTSGDDDYFVPFADATNGKETYGAGRYMEIHPLGGDRFLVDFNLAYNPWCAYSPYYSCPIPPAENRLDVPIEAGEKNFKNA